MQFIDTHVHLFMPDYQDKLAVILKRANKVGVDRFICPGIDFKTSQQAIELSKQYPSIIPAIGLHPMQPSENLERYRALAGLPEVKAIGEIGADIRANEITGWQHQEGRFRFFLELAQEVDKPVLVHTIKTWEETLGIIKEYPKLKGKVVMHCFAGIQEDLKRAAELDLHISCTAILARKGMNKTLEAIKDWPLERLMLETDGPWLGWPEEPWPNEPKTVVKIAQLIADLKQVSLEEVAQKTTQTAQEFFSISQ